MAKPIVLQPGLLLVKPQYSVDPDSGDHPENILWFVSSTTTTPTLANLTAMAQAFDPLWGNVWKAVGAGDRSYNGSIWTDMSTLFGLTYTSVGPFTPVSGTTAGGNLPSNAAVLISLHIQERWRGGHPRIYLPYISSGIAAGSDLSLISNAAQTQCSTAFAAINAGTTASGVLGGQSQRVYRERTNTTTAHLMPINSFLVQTRLATQRRRLRKAPHH